jgi:hypothetical protein
MGVEGSCWRGVHVGQYAVVWRSGGVEVEMVRGSSHQLKRSWRVEIAWSWALLVVEGALEISLEMASRLWTMVLTSVMVGMVKIAIHASKKAPQVVDTVDAVIGCLEKERQDGI